MFRKKQYGRILIAAVAVLGLLWVIFAAASTLEPTFISP
jgi:hypothetical protein